GNYLDQSGDAAIVITKANAVVTANGYTGAYDDLYHGATGSVAGVDAGGAAEGTSLDLGASFQYVPGGTAHWAFDGGINYYSQEGDVAIVITPKALTADSATTQSALNIAKDGSVAFRIDVDEIGIRDGQSVADLFEGVDFRLSVNGVVYSVQS